MMNVRIDALRTAVVGLSLLGTMTGAVSLSAQAVTPEETTRQVQRKLERFYRIYTDDFLSRYAPGGAQQVWREIRDERRFPGMQPVGVYPIHIIVKNGRTTLLGVVDNAADRQIAEIRAREVTGVFGVENGLQVTRQ